MSLKTSNEYAVLKLFSSFEAHDKLASARLILLASLEDELLLFLNALFAKTLNGALSAKNHLEIPDFFVKFSTQTTFHKINRMKNVPKSNYSNLALNLDHLISITYLKYWA